LRPELLAVPVAAAFLTGADDLKFLISLFDEILLSWNMFSVSEKGSVARRGSECISLIEINKV
jgi:hypothetical protein